MRKALLLLLVCPLLAAAQTSLDKPNNSAVTQISPYYFGPNAFPVPEMLDGTTRHDLRIELTGNHFYGFKKDHTTDITLRLNVPLFTDRVNLTVWMPVIEWYNNTDARLQECRLASLAETEPKARKGSTSGDVYISTDIHVVRQKKYVPDIAVRAAMKTASGSKYYYARYYDSPGYFFDATVAKSWALGATKAHDLRVAGSAGFLCWQTDNGRQNDALMFGVMLRWKVKGFALTQTFRGYNGWENNCGENGELARDCPMVLKTQLNYTIKKWEIQAAYQYGLRDYPFHQFQLGAAFNINILDIKSKKNKQ
ncbi:MAG: hypothetical protein HUK03_04400 [Bacteroidaceae bacterium]|nr:hypothetical protein [Bacteroidaceae bacterium]